MTSDLNMCDGKMSDFISFPLFGLTLLMKLRNFDFEIPVKQCLIWFKLRCLSRILAIS